MFEKIIGNDEIKEELNKTINTKKIANSYIFSGIEGIGKRQLAREFAKNIMCLQGGDCKDTCESCKKFEEKSNPNYEEINSNEYKKDIITIDQIREKIVNKAYEKPIISNKKIYVINDADKMNEPAQNALLKTLEEPPQYVVIILIVSNDNAILPTIKSRCVIVKFNSLTNDEIKKIIGNVSDEELEILNGSLKGYSKIEEKVVQYKEIKKIIERLKNDQLIDVLNNSDILYQGKDEAINLLNYMNIYLFKENLFDEIKYVEEAKKKILYNNNYEMTIDNLLMKMWNNIHNNR